MGLAFRLEKRHASARDGDLREQGWHERCEHKQWFVTFATADTEQWDAKTSPTETQKGGLMAGNTVEFTDANFQSEVLNSAEPVLVDFWAPWCGPCKMLTPTIDQLATEYAGRVKIGKVNTDDNHKTAASYGITSIPTVILFKGGQIVDKVVGVPPKQQFINMLDKALN